MNSEAAAKLREPFAPELIGTIPKGGVQLSYVGHAAVTDRLLQVDPEWTWEPFGDSPGLVESSIPGEPYGLWIKLTVAGVTRPGFGSGKNAKECISDAIRNAAMRFGVALDLWTKEDLHSNGNTPKQEASPFKQPDAAIKPDAEAKRLKAELLKLVPQHKDLIEKHAADKDWLGRQLATAQANASAK